MGTIEKIRALGSVLSSRAGLASSAGITFSGSRDLFTALGYKKDLVARDYRDRYKRNGIAGRVVEALPKATWRGKIELVEDEDPDTETTFEAAWNELSKRLNIWSTLLRTDTLAGLGRYSVLLIGAPGDLEAELPNIGNIDGVLYLSPFSEDDASIDTLVDDTSDPRYGQPLKYKFKRLATGLSQGTKLVHWSRVLHVADGILDEQIYGEPRLERVWNNLDDLEKVAGSGSEAFWLRAHQGYQLDVPPEVEMSETDMTSLSDEVDEYIHGIRRFMRTRGVELTALGSDVANFANQVDAIITLIAGSTGIPKRILVGSEMGELASTQDRTNWHERIDDRREQYAEPQIIRPFVDRLIQYGALPAPIEYEVRWPQIQNLNDEEKAGVADKLAGLNKKIGETVITGAEIRDRILQLPMLEEIVDEPIEEEEEVVEEPNEEEPLVAAGKKQKNHGQMSIELPIKTDGSLH